MHRVDVQCIAARCTVPHVFHAQTPPSLGSFIRVHFWQSRVIKPTVPSKFQAPKLPPSSLVKW